MKLATHDFTSEPPRAALTVSDVSECESDDLLQKVCGAKPAKNYQKRCHGQLGTIYSKKVT